MADDKPQPLENQLPGLKEQYPTATRVEDNVAYDASGKALGSFGEKADDWGTPQLANQQSADDWGTPQLAGVQSAGDEWGTPQLIKQSLPGIGTQATSIGPHKPFTYTPEERIEEFLHPTEAYKKEHPILGGLGERLRHLRETFEPGVMAATTLSLGPGEGFGRTNVDAYNHAAALRDGSAAAYQARLAEYDSQISTAQKASEAAVKARADHEAGLISPEQRVAIENQASVAHSEANKAAKALSEAWKTHSESALEANRIQDKVNRQANIRTQQRSFEANQRFKRAVPPGRTNAAAYTNEDLNIVRGYLEDHHQNVKPINTIQDAYDTLGRVKNDIENQIQPYVQKYGKESITTNPLSDVQAELHKSPNTSFTEDGMRELEKWNLIDPTVEEAQRILTNLNAENRAILESNPQVQIGTHLQTDPGFAARYHAAESLRDGIYGRFEEHGVTGTRQVRQIERAAIKVENAVRQNLPHGEAKVRPGGPKDVLGKTYAKNSLTRNDMMAKSFDVQGAGIPKINVGGPGTPSVLESFDTPSDYDPNELSWQDMHRVNQEYGDLHSALASHYTTPINSTNYGNLESRFMLDMEQKLNNGYDLEPNEADLFKQINQARGQALQQFSKANVQLGPTPDPTLPNNPKPHMIIRGPWQDGMDSVNGMVHELAHSTVAKELLGDKLPIAEIVGDKHPDAQGVGGMAAVVLDWPNSSFVDAQGNLDIDKVIDNFDDLAAVYMAGGVANDLYHDIPIHLNKHLGSDIKAFNNLMDTVGVPSELRSAVRQDAINRAAEILGRPGTADVLHSHAEVREPNLPNTKHFSSERLDQVHEDLQTRWDYEDRKGKLTSNVRGTGGGTKQTTGNRGGTPAGRKSAPGAKGSVRENGGAQSKGNKGSRENVPISRQSATATLESEGPLKIEEPVKQEGSENTSIYKFTTSQGGSGELQVRVNPDDDVAEIQWMGGPVQKGGFNPKTGQGTLTNKLGISGLRQLLNRIKTDYPKVKSVEGMRIGGKAAGTLSPFSLDISGE